jgi:hypothetical protein
VYFPKRRRKADDFPRTSFHIFTENIKGIPKDGIPEM